MVLFRILWGSLSNIGNAFDALCTSDGVACVGGVCVFNIYHKHKIAVKRLLNVLGS